MKPIYSIVLGCLLGAAVPALAQEPRPAPADTTDAAAIERRLLEELGREDTTDQIAVPPPAGAAASLNPNISAIADFLADLSPDEGTLDDGDRFQIREVELGVQGAVDPYFRFDIFLGFHPDEVEIEEAYATTQALPANLQAKLGKFHLPFGKVNLTHRPELHTIDYPLYIQRYFGGEGLSSTGVWGSVIGAPLGFYQEVSVVATNGSVPEPGEHEHAAEEEEPVAKDLGKDLGERLWVAHLKNSIDFTEAANLELGGSVATAKDDEGRTSFYAIDGTYRWKPPQMSKYRSAVLQSEVAWRDAAEGGTRLGAFVFGQWQLTRRSHIGARWDYVELPDEEEAGSIKAGQVILRWFPTEFSQFRAAYERRVPDVGDALDRLLFQATFALGPHRPHAF